MKLYITFSLSAIFSTAVMAQSASSPKLTDTARANNRGNVMICTVSRGHLLSKAPLYVVYLKNKLIYRSDSAQVKTDVLSTIKQEDIASIEILKDAAATAIWGSAGMWGVIQIQLTDSVPADRYKSYTPEVKPRQNNAYIFSIKQTA